MREIKFRAWDKEAKKMIPVDMVYFRGWADGEKKPKGDIRRAGFVQGIGYYVTYDFFLMQYIGLKDKNGKEIYEGDIVEEDGDVWRCIYLPESACFAFQEADDEYGDFLEKAIHIANFEIIGNIYENPELIK